MGVFSLDLVHLAAISSVDPLKAQPEHAAGVPNHRLA
jgi:hypothetical protein